MRVEGCGPLVAAAAVEAAVAAWERLVSERPEERGSGGEGEREREIGAVGRR